MALCSILLILSKNAFCLWFHRKRRLAESKITVYGTRRGKARGDAHFRHYANSEALTFSIEVDRSRLVSFLWRQHFTGAGDIRLFWSFLCRLGVA